VKQLWLSRTKLVITSIEEELDSMLNDDPLAKTLTPYCKKLKDFKDVYSSWFRDKLKKELKQMIDPPWPSRITRTTESH
jgi:hypothetical protein